MKKKQIIQFSVGIATSAIALWFVFKDITLSQLFGSLKEVDYKWMVPTLAIFYFGVWLRGLRWSWLFRPANKVPVSHAVGGIFICFALNSILPARAGEFARAWLIGKRDRTGFSTAAGTVVAERLLDAITLLPCLMLALMIAPIPATSTFTKVMLGRTVTMTGQQFAAAEHKLMFLCAVLILGIFCVSIPYTRGLMLRVLHMMRFIPLLVRNKIEEMVHKFAEGLGSFRSPTRFLSLLAMSFLIWATTAASAMFLAWGFPFAHAMSFAQGFALIIIICIFIMVPAAPGYWGFYEAGVVFAIVMMGIHPDADAPVVASYAIVLHLTQWIPIVAIGLPWAWMSHISMGKEQEEETALLTAEADVK